MLYVIVHGMVRSGWREIPVKLPINPTYGIVSSDVSTDVLSSSWEFPAPLLFFVLDAYTF